LRTHKIKILSGLLALAVVPAIAAAASAQTATVAKAQAPDMVPFLVNGDGKTLYVVKSENGKSSCDAKCMESLEPLLTKDRPLGQMVLPGLLGTVDKNGAKQVTYRGQPLFTFKQDAKAGDFKGQGYQNAVYVMSAMGEAEVPTAPVAEAGPVTPEVLAAGKALFASNCAACHGANGEGAFGTKLQGFARLSNGPAVARTILAGMNSMPGFAATLSDEQVAAISTFVRNSWGNEFGAVSAEQVKTVR